MVLCFKKCFHHITWNVPVSSNSTLRQFPERIVPSRILDKPPHRNNHLYNLVHHYGDPTKSRLSHSFRLPRLWTQHQEVMPKSCPLVFHPTHTPEIPWKHPQLTSDSSSKISKKATFWPLQNVANAKLHYWHLISTKLRHEMPLTPIYKYHSTPCFTRICQPTGKTIETRVKLTQSKSDEFLLERIHYTRKRPDNLKETASIPTSVYQLSAWTTKCGKANPSLRTNRRQWLRMRIGWTTGGDEGCEGQASQSLLPRSLLVAGPVKCYQVLTWQMVTTNDHVTLAINRKTWTLKHLKTHGITRMKWKNVCICTPDTDLTKMSTLRISNPCVLQMLSSIW